ncbi:MAG: hypothetical protein AAGJ97_06030 [Planctomycetota bacterium]
MTEPKPTAATLDRRTILPAAILLTAVIASGAGWAAQHFIASRPRIDELTTRLARYEPEPIPSALGAGKMRVIGRKLLEVDRSDGLLATAVLVESRAERFLVAEEISGGERVGRQRVQMERAGQDGPYRGRVILVVDHTEMSGVLRLGVFCAAGGLHRDASRAGGSNIAEVASDFEFDPGAAIRDIDGVYDEDAMITVLEVPARHPEHAPVRVVLRTEPADDD